MTDAHVSNRPALESLVARVADEYIERQKQGEDPDVEEYAARYPEFATVLREVLAALQLVRLSGISGSSGARTEESLAGTLGDFRLIREVGRGGMGIVYEAEQISLGRRVALKVLPFAATLDTKQLRRFKNEAQAAATLQHQNIVPVYFVGCERGVHYYAMQFVDGQTLAEVIADLRLQIADLKEATASSPAGEPSRSSKSCGSQAICNLQSEICNQTQVHLSTVISRHDTAFFRTVARLGEQAALALDHAHQLGVVHRDIKPANLLVENSTSSLRLWITDFGLARCQSQAGLTMTGELVGTIRYMSPEQALAKPVVLDHRTDIYSLGATLYELVTLEPIFAGANRDELLRQIACHEPIAPRRIDKAIPVDLETIVLKAVAKAPGERYATAQEMADDLRRYLEDKPIAARRPTLVQHVRRWCRRHKPLVTSALVCVLVAVTALAVSIGFITGDRSARTAVAEEKAGLAFEESLAFQQQERWFEALSAIKRAEGLLAGGGSQEVQERVRRRRADLELVATLDKIRLESSAALKGDAFDIAPRDAAYMQAFREYGLDLTLAKPEDAAAVVRATGIRVELAAALDDWAIVCRTTRPKDDTTWRDLLAIARAADPDALRNQVRDALERRDQRSLKELIASDQAITLPPSTVLLLVRILRGVQAGEQDASRSPHPRAILLLRQAQRIYPHDFWLNQELAWHLASARRWHEAMRFYSIALALRPHSALAHVTLSFALLSAGQADDARACCQKAIRLEPELAPAHNNLGYALRLKGELDQAVRCYQDALRLQPGLVSAHINLGNALRDKGQWAAALDCYRKALRLNPRDSRAQHNLTRLLRHKGSREQAVAAFEEVVRLKPRDAAAHTNLGWALMEAGRLSDAIKAHEKAITLDPGLAKAHSNRGAALRRQARLRDAIAAYRAAIRLDPKFAIAHANLAWVLSTAPDEKLRDSVQAVEGAKKAVELAPQVAAFWQRLGVSHYRAGDAKAALNALRRSVKLSGSGDGVDLFFLAMAHWKLGDKDEAIQCYRQARAMTKADDDQRQRVYQPLEDELRRFQAEAVWLLGVDE